MATIDHLSVGVPDIEVACRFYDPVLSTVGCTRLATAGRLAAYGKARAGLIIIQPYDKTDPSAGKRRGVTLPRRGTTRVIGALIYFRQTSAPLYDTASRRSGHRTKEPEHVPLHVAQTGISDAS